MTPAPLDDLLAVLAAEGAELRRLLPLLEQERAALMRVDAPAVAALTGEKELALGELKRLEARRQGCLAQLATAYGVSVDSLTLSGLARLVASPERLEALRRTLRADLARLAAVNDGNRFLVEQSLRHVHGLLGAVKAALAETPTYGAGGRSAETASTRAVLDRTA
jgi:flagellar biosynthesis/type III secretory pathway chaperone